jgi:hypothetical protein
MLHPNLRASIIFDRKFCRVVSILSFAHHSITSSAREKKGRDGEAKCFCSLEIDNEIELVGCSTGISAGFAPRRIYRQRRRVEYPGSLVKEIRPPAATNPRIEYIVGNRARAMVFMIVRLVNVSGSPTTKVPPLRT